MSRSEWGMPKNDPVSYEFNSNSRRQTTAKRTTPLRVSTEGKHNSLDPSIANDSDSKATKLGLSRTTASVSSESFAASATELPPRQLRLSRTAVSDPSAASATELPPRQLRLSRTAVSDPSAASSTALPPRQRRGSTSNAAPSEDLSPPRRAGLGRCVTPESSPRRLAPPPAADDPCAAPADQVRPPPSEQRLWQTACPACHSPTQAHARHLVPDFMPPRCPWWHDIQAHPPRRCPPPPPPPLPLPPRGASE
jgi:hypothetical protein